MYLTSLFRTSNLNRFFSLSIIRELELDDGLNEFDLDDDDDDTNNSVTSECHYPSPPLIPSYFNSMLIMKDNLMSQSSITHGLVSVDDKIIQSTGRMNTAGGSSWPLDKDIIYFPSHESSFPHSLSLSSSSSEDGEESWVGSSPVQCQSDLVSGSDEDSDSSISEKKLCVWSRRTASIKNTKASLASRSLLFKEEREDQEKCENSGVWYFLISKNNIHNFIVLKRHKNDVSFRSLSASEAQ